MSATAAQQEPCPAARIEQVTFRYENGSTHEPVLEDVSLTVDCRDFLGLIGPNGGGKTTLLKILLGLLMPQDGTVEVFGQPPREARNKVGYVPQHALIELSTPGTVLDVVLTGRLGRSGWGMWYGTSHKDAAREAMRQVGVEDLADRRMGDISGGQRQRVLIARALSADAQMLLLDEPMAGVDLHMEKGILETLQKLNEKMPIILVSHDIGFVSKHVKRVACLSRKLVVRRTEEVTHDIIGEMYGAPVLGISHSPECPLSEGGEHGHSH